MNLACQNSKFSLLKFIICIVLMVLAVYSESHAKTIPTDAQFKKNPRGMCGRACQNLKSCQNDEELNKKCWQFCAKPPSGCVRRGEKPEESASPSLDKPDQSQKPASDSSSQKWSPTQCKDYCHNIYPCRNNPERAQQCLDHCGPDVPCLKKD